ncbi:class I SAM-dependent methyltransferase [Streptomyces sp. NPDC047860]|uniref:class I SAM-dependent methyltransferase n=1 Tax=Streptomyces sp. NPDC047860 TaxID=3155743 RepID=UPI00340DBC99
MTSPTAGSWTSGPEPATHHAVHLVQAHEARVTGIELSPTEHERAVSAHADAEGVEFVQGDVVEYLAGAEPFDAARDRDARPHLNASSSPTSSWATRVNAIQEINPDILALH